MISINLIGDNVSITIGEDAYVIPYDADSYAQVNACAEAANSSETVEEYNKCVESMLKLVETYSLTTDSLIASKCDYLVHNELTDEYFLVYYNDQISDIPMPESLVERIMDSIDKGVDFMPVIKLWTRFLRNPNLPEKGNDFAQRFADFVNMKYVHPKLMKQYLEQGLTAQKALELATVYQIKITNEGLLNGYKVSREVLHKYDAETGERVPRYKRTFNVNTGEIESEGLPAIVEDRLFEPAVMGSRGDAFYCGDTKGHFIRVGQRHALESWEQVNCNDESFCVKGLHIGGLHYINGYGGEIHNVFVDPMHIGAVPNSTDGAIRCKEYFVHSSLAGVNGSMYHSSTYAELTEAEWEEMRKEALELNKKANHKVEEQKHLLRVM